MPRVGETKSTSLPTSSLDIPRASTMPSFALRVPHMNSLNATVPINLRLAKKINAEVTNCLERRVAEGSKYHQCVPLGSRNTTNPLVEPHGRSEH